MKCQICGEYKATDETNGIQHCNWESCENEAAQPDIKEKLEMEKLLQDMIDRC